MISRRRKDHSTLKRVALGSTIAAGLGYVAGVLTAPKSGKATRKELRKNANKSIIRAEKDLKKVHTELDKAIKEGKQRSAKLGSKGKAELNELIDKAKDTKEKAREVLSAIHEGDAEDKDLQRAVNEASKAVKHLRTYLKK